MIRVYEDAFTYREPTDEQADEILRLCDTMGWSPAEAALHTEGVPIIEAELPGRFADPGLGSYDARHWGRDSSKDEGLAEGLDSLIPSMPACKRQPSPKALAARDGDKHRDLGEIPEKAGNWPMVR